MPAAIFLYKDNNGKKCVRFDEDCVVKKEKHYTFSSFDPDTTITVQNDDGTTMKVHANVSIMNNVHIVKDVNYDSD